MKKYWIVAAILWVQVGLAQQKDYRLWYNKPAANWEEALPLGNGRLGAMVFGEPKKELLQLNEETLWTGGPKNLDPNPVAHTLLATVRKDILQDSIDKAVQNLYLMQGPDVDAYQPLGDLWIEQPGLQHITNYYRDLNISNATATTRFQSGGVNFTRTVFISAPDDVMVIRLQADKAKALEVRLTASHPFPYKVAVQEGNQLVLEGKARIGSDDRRKIKPIRFEDSLQCKGMRFQFRVMPLYTDGIVEGGDTSLHISKASEIVLLVSAATSYNGFRNCPDQNGRDEVALCKSILKAAAQKEFQQMLTAHLKDYTSYFNRLSISLKGAAVPDVPADERLKAYAAGAADLHLEEMYFQFGRYLLISSSRPGGVAANLQGIWNPLVSPPWRSNFTTNINLQMNYWPAAMTNLADLTAPLITQIQHMAANGGHTAWNYYRAKGWVAHHNSDIWAMTNPSGDNMGDPKWANWVMGSPWLCQHLYEHYLFTGNRTFLRDTAYPIMKGAADFCLDWLVEKDGILITVPSTSPENEYIHPKGYKGKVTIASAMDMEIIWDLFTNLIEASKILGIDETYATLLTQKRSMLNPLKVGKKGNLVEWFDDWEDEEPQHRHVSHLFGLHPGRQISPWLQPEFAAASRKTLEIRGDGGTGWSKAWKINFWARLLDGDHAHKMYREIISHSTLNNLFDTHPPFQIDGNFGSTSGVGEMLLQSHLGFIQPLAALPKAWASGQLQGMVARGNFEIDMQWDQGKLTTMKVLSRLGNECVLRTEAAVSVSGQSVLSQKVDGPMPYYETRFATEPGKLYVVTSLK